MSYLDLYDISGAIKFTVVSAVFAVFLSLIHLSLSFLSRFWLTFLFLSQCGGFWCWSLGGDM